MLNIEKKLGILKRQDLKNQALINKNGEVIQLDVNPFRVQVDQNGNSFATGVFGSMMAPKTPNKRLLDGYGSPTSPESPNKSVIMGGVSTNEPSLPELTTQKFDLVDKLIRKKFLKSPDQNRQLS